MRAQAELAGTSRPFGGSAGGTAADCGSGRTLGLDELLEALLRALPVQSGHPVIPGAQREHDRAGRAAVTDQSGTLRCPAKKIAHLVGRGGFELDQQVVHLLLRGRHRLVSAAQVQAQARSHLVDRG